MTWLDKLHHPEHYIKLFFKWGLLGILMGALGGLYASQVLQSAQDGQYGVKK